MHARIHACMNGKGRCVAVEGNVGASKASGAPAMTAQSFTMPMAFSNSTYRMQCSQPCTNYRTNIRSRHRTREGCSAQTARACSPHLQ